jgi:hypothetical protein
VSDQITMHEAIQKAKEAIVDDVYQNEEVSDVDVEEIDRDDDGDWLITIGFRRPNVRTTLGLTFPMRTLKRVKIDRYSGEFKAMKMYQPDN